jgi:hypothetical protein
VGLGKLEAASFARVWGFHFFSHSIHFLCV